MACKGSSAGKKDDAKRMTPSSATGKSIETVLLELDLPLSDTTVRDLTCYAEEIVRWNRRVNLTGAKTADQFVKGPLFDALTVMKVLASEKELVDIGSGGGLPGIPIALLLPEVSVTLVEPRAKRAVFLKHIVHHLKLKARVLQCRMEMLEETFGAAVAQAVWPPEEWLRQSKLVVNPAGNAYVLSAAELLEDAMPDGTTPEACFVCRHPESGNPRYSYRVKI